MLRSIAAVFHLILKVFVSETYCLRRDILGNLNIEVYSTFLFHFHVPRRL